MTSAEPLESRRLLAATIDNGVLVATGTSGNDVISVRRVLADDVVVTINGAAQTFDMDDFTGVRLTGLGGNDTFSLLDPLVSPVVRNTTVIGGSGSDTVDYSTRTTSINLAYNTEGPFGSQVTQGTQTDRFTSIETVLGGSGNDTFTYSSSGPPDESVDGQPAETDTEILIDGRGGNDLFVDSLATFQWLRGVTLVGGAGNDTFDADEIGSERYFGGPGNDLFRFHNESGPDSRFSGGDGIDTVDLSDTFKLGGLTDMRRTPDIENAVGIREMLIGNPLSNRLEALQIDSDEVTIIGGEGNDTIIGGSADDLLQGEGGDDSLVGNAGNDTLDGGPGTDTLSGGTGVNVFQEGEVMDDPTAPTIAIESDVLVASLVATGTGGNDTFTVRRHLNDNVIVTVNALSREFDMDDFFGIRFEGFGGNDTFRMIDPLVSPVVRNTTVIGGGGSDRLVYSTRTSPLQFDIDPTATTSTVAGGAQLDHFADVETLVGGAGNDRFNLRQQGENDEGRTVSYRLEGRDGNDAFVDGIWPSSDAYGFVTMLGGAGDDRFSDESDQRFTREVFFGEAGNDTVGKYRSAGTFDGGSGIDTLNFRSGSGNLGNFPGFENATATWGGDSDAPISLTGTDGPNHLSIDGSGTINGLGGNDTIVGSDEADTLNGGGGDDLILGAWGDDEIDGGPGFDALDGGVGNDTLVNGEVIPGAGRIFIANRILTAEGTWGGELITIGRVGIDDVIVRIDGLARAFDMDDFDGVLLKGGAGYDQITVLDSLLTPVERKVTLDGGDGNDTLDGHDGNDVLRGGNGNDQIRGGGGRNALFGDAGNDFLSASGAALPSFLDGGGGDDFLYADNGIKDTVLGGAGDEDEATVDTLDEALGIEHLLVR